MSLRNDKVRIRIDPSNQNKAIKREHHPIKAIQEVVSNMTGARVFSVRDAKSGYLQIKLDDESSKLTTFNTSTGRHRCLRLPFGIKSAPEIFQRAMQMLEGITGATATMDNILIAGLNTEHHDQIFRKVKERAIAYNLRPNYHIRRTAIPYVNHTKTAEGLQPAPEKVRAITDMTEPQDQAGVKR